MAGFFPNNNSGSNSRWGTPLAQGFKNANEQTNARVKMLNDYHAALEKKDNHERIQKKQDQDVADHMLTNLSRNYPIGNQKAEIQLQNLRLQQPDVYKEMANTIKKGRPWAVKDGEILRYPDHEARIRANKADMDAIELRMANKTATHQDINEYYRKHFENKVTDKALRMATSKTDANGKYVFDSMPPEEQASLVASFEDGMKNATMQSLFKQGLDPALLKPGDLTPTKQPQGQPQSQGDNPFLNFLASAGVSGVGNMMQNQNAPALTMPPQQPDQVNPQGVQPNQGTQLDPLAIANSIIAKRQQR